MVIELSLGGLLTLLGIPTAITSLGLWILQRKMAKREEIRDKREAAREQNEVLLIQNTRAALVLAEATPRRGRPAHPGCPLQRGHARRP